MNTNQKIVITCLAAILVVLIIVIACFAGTKKEPQVNDFVAPAVEQTAVVGVPTNVDAALNYQSFSVEDKMTIGLCGNLMFKEDNTVDVYFTSDASNTFLTKMKLLDEAGNVLGESGLISPGEYVQSIVLINPPKSSTTVVAKILTYEEETYYSQGSVTVQVMLNVE